MARQAVGLRVTGRARSRRSVGVLGVLLPEERGVRRRWMADDLGTSGALRTGLLHQRHRLGKRDSLVTGGTARLGVAGSATCRIPQRCPAVTAQPAGSSMRWRCSKGEAVYQRSLILCEGLNRGNLRRIHVAPDTEVPSVAGRATRRHGPAPAAGSNLGKLPVPTAKPESRRLVPVRNRKTTHRLRR